eukprot:TRINITY_DN30488_c0_g1_i1.p1 TRINITY_DN30488_c0_g1~~TRINITY_DN30488_c0_g1_i1.p1  ORF type:complete len:703 (-),score=124.31 TRINITY_DN30488_c0_g1_i1:29-2137(-)
MKPREERRFRPLSATVGTSEQVPSSPTCCAALAALCCGTAKPSAETSKSSRAGGFDRDGKARQTALAAVKSGGGPGRGEAAVVSGGKMGSASAAPATPLRAQTHEPLECNLSRFYETNTLFAPPALKPLPVIVITGFLGSGKTTLVQRLMTQRENLRIATIAHDLAANENVDASFIAASEKALRKADTAVTDGSVVGMSGCGCCDEFEEALRGIVGASVKQGVDAGLLDYLAVETSGAADPRRLIASLEQRFGPLTRARLDRVVAVVDADQVASAEAVARKNGGGGWLSSAATSGPAGRAHEERLQRVQLACADVVLLNKVDLVEGGGEGMLGACEKRLHQLAPHARLLRCSFGNVPITELLEVNVVPSSTIGAVSHEKVTTTWTVEQDLEPRSRPSAMASTDAVAGGNLEMGSSHAPRHRVVEWSCAELPVHLPRLQELLVRRLTVWTSLLRRGKGALWIAEDPQARWEWQLSGRLRYASRRDGGGFGGAAPRSYLVLIFAADVSEAVLNAARNALDELTLPPPPLLTDALTDTGINEAYRELSDGKLAFEVLDDPLVEDAAKRYAAGRVLRFRLTGRTFFDVPESVDLLQPPYVVDLNGLNQELARMVSAMQGGTFLAVGEGLERNSGRLVVALLWPMSLIVGESAQETAMDTAGDLQGLPPPPPQPVSPFSACIAAARVEAEPLLRRFFAHVTSCKCGA